MTNVLDYLKGTILKDQRKISRAVYHRNLDKEVFFSRCVKQTHDNMFDKNKNICRQI